LQLKLKYGLGIDVSIVSLLNDINNVKMIDKIFYSFFGFVDKWSNFFENKISKKKSKKKCG